MHRVLLMVVLGGCVLLPGQASDAIDSWDPANTYAVIIGVTRFESDLTKYPRRHRKDRELRDLLIQRGTPPKQISLLLDSEATLENIRQTIKSTLSAASANSTLLIYYAGHGWKAGDDFCFANYDVVLGEQMFVDNWKLSKIFKKNSIYSLQFL